jgi:hypothetical protein
MILLVARFLPCPTHLLHQDWNNPLSIFCYLPDLNKPPLIKVQSFVSMVFLSFSFPHTLSALPLNLSRVTPVLRTPFFEPPFDITTPSIIPPKRFGLSPCCLGAIFTRTHIVAAVTSQ